VQAGVSGDVILHIDTQRVKIQNTTMNMDKNVTKRLYKNIYT